MKPSQVKALERLSQRRYPPAGGYTTEQARELAGLSTAVGRQIGLLIDRQGRPRLVIVGEPSSILIPDLGRVRAGSGRLRGVRLLHTHLSEEPLSQEDLLDMLFLRLDGVAALTVANGEPRTLHAAYLLPPNPEGRKWQILPPVRWDLTQFDFSAQAEALEEELARAEAGAADVSGRERALLVHVSELPKSLQESSLKELSALADTAGLSVAGTVSQRVRQLNPRFILGKGKLAELETQALQGGAGIIVFDRELSPAQARNISEVTERRILDRTQLILDIFAQHAKSLAGKLQVELAQLEYMLPHLVGQNKNLSRLMGGIGGRGPGETKLEIDRRRVRERVTRVRRELTELRKRRKLVRARRAKSGLPVVSLVGYTNAGKSTLLNTLTQSNVLAENKLFATLDPASRRIRFPRDREVILTDTVGFIRELPEKLKEAFRATLEELTAADLLIHVADASHPEVEEQITAVEAILKELELSEVRTVLALNKWDAASPEQRAVLSERHPEAVAVSALKRASLEPLVARILEALDLAGAPAWAEVTADQGDQGDQGESEADDEPER